MSVSNEGSLQMMGQYHDASDASVTKQIAAATLATVARRLECDDAGWTIIQTIREMVIPCRDIEKHLDEARRLLDACWESWAYIWTSCVSQSRLRAGSYGHHPVSKVWREANVDAEKVVSELWKAALLAMPVLKGRYTVAWQQEDGQKPEGTVPTAGTVAVPNITLGYGVKPRTDQLHYRLVDSSDYDDIRASRLLWEFSKTALRQDYVGKWEHPYYLMKKVEDICEATGLTVPRKLYYPTSIRYV